MAPVLLEVDGLSAGYGDIRATWDVALSVLPGRVTAILGRNGAGKTTTLAAIAGLLKARSGTVTFLGEDVTGLPAYTRMSRGMGLVQENKRVFRARTVEENLVIGGFSMPRRSRRQALDKAYERFPILSDKRHQRAGSLSGGQQQMLAIAQALMPGPRLLLLDEPSAGLAPVIVDEVIRTIRHLKDEGIGILLVEQLMDRALSVADHVVLLDRGRVATSIPRGQLTDLGGLRDLYLGATGAARDLSTPAPESAPATHRPVSD